MANISDINTDLFISLNNSKANIETYNLIKNKIIDNNIGLIHLCVKKYIFVCNRIEYDDLFQEGILGLMAAIDGFDVSKGFSFSSYAYESIKRQICNYITANENMIRIPQDLSLEIAKAKNDNNTEKYTELINLQQTISLDAKVMDEEDSTLGDFIPDKNNFETLVENKLLKEYLTQCIDEVESLYPKSKNMSKFIKYRFGFITGQCENLEDSSKYANLNKNKAKNLENIFLRQIRFYMKQNNIKYQDLK